MVSSSLALLYFLLGFHGGSLSKPDQARISSFIRLEVVV